MLGNLGKRPDVDTAAFADTQGMPERAGGFAAREADVRVDWNFQMGKYAASGLTSAHRAYKYVCLCVWGGGLLGVVVVGELFGGYCWGVLFGGSGEGGAWTVM